MSLPLAAILAVALLLLSTAGVALFFASKIIWPKRFGMDEARDIEVEKGYIDLGSFSSWESREVRIGSPFGYSLEGTWYPVAGARKAVILAHGVTFNRWGAIKYAGLFRELGFSCLAVDQRWHGRSGGPNSTFGWFERRDMAAWTDWVLSELGEGGVVGTHGESMGAAVALQHAGIDPRLAFVVADCAFSDLPELLAYRIREDFHLPPQPLLSLAGAAAWLATGGMVFGGVRPVASCLETGTPILFVHGDADAYIPPAMSVAMHEARLKAGMASSLYLARDGGHAESFAADPAEYRRRLGTFLAGLGLA